MATKTISITEDAYKNLVRMRTREKESFSEVINRALGNNRLSELKGILSDKSADDLRKSIKEGRRTHRNSHKKRNKKFSNEF